MQCGVRFRNVAVVTECVQLNNHQQLHDEGSAVSCVGMTEQSRDKICLIHANTRLWSVGLGW